MRTRDALFALVPAAMLAATVACTEERPKPAAPEDASASAPPSAAPSVHVPDEAKWLVQGSSDERFVKIASQLRGFDVAMVETGYRYGELYWAGRDENYDYARYQLQPTTGHRHQLRVHMAGLGLPLVGDGIYPQLTAEGVLDHQRPLQLLAKVIEFIDPLSGQPRVFHSTLSLRNLADVQTNTTHLPG